MPIMLYVLILLDYISYSPTTTRMYMPTVIILFFGGKVIAKKCGFDNVRQLKSVNTIRMSDLDRNSQVRISNER